ncbi:MAG: hypothetical protein IPG45_02325 [Deltaproteobacteria bacterium]|nr:hypothetical protein [Deltaproteobacteria bacterium]
MNTPRRRRLEPTKMALARASWLVLLLVATACRPPSPTQQVQQGPPTPPQRRIERRSPTPPLQDNLQLEAQLRTPGEVPAWSNANFEPKPTSAPPKSATSTLSLGPNPPIEPPRPPDGPSVLHYGPTGEIEGHEHLEVIFSEPMVAPEVKLVPEPPGRWRQLGDTAVIFEAEGGFPRGTDFRVEVPAGLSALRGPRLPAPVHFVFSTAPPAVLAGPSVEQPQRPTLQLFFDQPVWPASVFAVAELWGPNGRVTLDPPSELAATLEPTLRPTRPLLAGARYRLRIGPGVIGKNGQRKSVESSEHLFSVRPPLSLVRAECRGVDGCRPGAPLVLVFDRPLDPESWSQVSLLVEPPIPGLTAAIEGEVVVLEGPTAARTRYQLHLAGALADPDGDVLAQPVEAQLTTTGLAPALRAEGRSLLYLPADRGAELLVHSVNHPELLVAVYRTQPEDWPAYLRYLSRPYAKDSPSRPPGVRVLEQRVTVGAEPDRWAATRVDLGGALTASVGHAIVEVRPTRRALERWQRNRPPTIRRWVQVTRLGLDAHVGRGNLLAWVTDLSDGRPRAGVKVGLAPAGPRGVTETDGTTLLTLPKAAPPGVEVVLMAESGADRAFLPESRWAQGQSRWIAKKPAPSTRIQIVDPVGRHQPGSTARLLGWVRRWSGGPQGHLQAVDAEHLHYRLNDSAGVRLASGRTPLSAHGGFRLELPLPADAQLGWARLELGLTPGGVDEGLDLSLEGPPGQEPKLTLKTPATAAVRGTPWSMKILAEGADGLPLPDAELVVSTTIQDGRFRPARLEGYTFGRERPADDGSRNRATSPRTPVTGRTDPRGEAELALHLTALDPPRPIWLDLSVKGPQRARGQGAVLVHPARYYPGLRVNRAFVTPGSPPQVELLVVDLEGQVVPEVPVEITLNRVTPDGERPWPQGLKVESQSGPLGLELGPLPGGRYRLQAALLDPEGRRNESAAGWVVASSTTPLARDPRRAELILERRRYAPGDTAEVLLLSPFFPAEALLTVRRHGLLTTRQFRLEAPAQTLRLQLGPELVPGVQLNVELLSTQPQDNLQTPNWAVGTVWIPVRPRRPALSLELNPIPEGWSASPHFERRPLLGAELWWLELRGKGPRAPDPLNFFSEVRHSEVLDLYGRAELYEGRGAPPPDPPVIAEGLPTRSAPLDLALPESTTREVLHLGRGEVGPSGEVEIPRTSPARDHLWVWANDGVDRFGFTEVVEPPRVQDNLHWIAPPFLRFGDRPVLRVEVPRGVLPLRIESPGGVWAIEDVRSQLVWAPGRAPQQLEWSLPPEKSTSRFSLPWRETVGPGVRSARWPLFPGAKQDLPGPSPEARQVLYVLPPGLIGLGELIRPWSPLANTQELADQLQFELAWRSLRQAREARDPVLSHLATQLLASLERRLSNPERLAALDALLSARSAGLSLPETPLLRQRSWLEGLEGTPDLQAWAVALLARVGEADPARTRRLAKKEGLSPEGAARLWTLVQGTQSPKAELRLSQLLDQLLAGPSQPRAEALWREALMSTQPNDPRLAQLTARLQNAPPDQATRRLAAPTLMQSRQVSTMELDLSVEVDAEHHAAVRLIDPFEVPSSFPSDRPITVRAEGQGQAELLLFETQGEIPAHSEGPSVTRSYHLGAGPDSTSFPEGVWVTVQIELVVPRALSQVVLHEPWPAGLAPRRPQVFGPPGHLVQGEDHFRWYAEELPAGVHHLEYQAQARWPGHYAAPPAELKVKGGRAWSASQRLQITQ